MAYQPQKIESLADLQALVPGTSLEALGVSIESIDDDEAAVTMPITDGVKQPMGILHGGITMFLLETAASIHACWGVDLAVRAPVGVEINASHLRSATDGTLRAVAKVIRRSHTFVVHQVDAYHVESGRHISTGRMTSYYLRTGAEGAANEAANV